MHPWAEMNIPNKDAPSHVFPSVLVDLALGPRSVVHGRPKEGLSPKEA
jgi:hypothetical protein